MITIYERNIWKGIIKEHHPRYMPFNDFTVSLNIKDQKYVDALEAEPLLHQKLIDNLNDFVNSKTYVYLSNKVFKTELNVQMHINNRNFNALTKEYREFDEFTRYLLSVTNDNLKHVVGETITAVAKDKRAVGWYHAGIGFKMVVKIVGIGFSIVTLAVGTASVVASVFTAGTTSVPAIAGLVVGFVGLVQSTCELAREIVKAIEKLEMAKMDAISSLKLLEKRYAGNSNAAIGAREVLGQGVNKVFSGFVELNTIVTLTGKFDLWEKKILEVDQKCHKMARNLAQILLKADEIKRVINMASRPPVPSREGITIKVPPPVPSRANKPTFNTQGQFAPKIPSRQGRVSANALRDIYAQNTPPPIPSRFERMPTPSTKNTPAPHARESEQFEHTKQIQKKKNQLDKVCRNVNKTIPKIQNMQIEVRSNRRANTDYKHALIKLKGRKPRAAEFIEAFNNVAVDLTKVGINVGLGGHGMYEGLADTTKTTASVIHTIGSFVVENTVEAAQFSLDLTDGIGELGDALKEKDEIDRNISKRQFSS